MEMGVVSIQEEWKLSRSADLSPATSLSLSPEPSSRSWLFSAQASIQQRCVAHSVELLGETDHYLIIGDLSHGPREEDRLDWTAVEFGRLCLLGDGHQLRWHPVSYLRTPADWYLANEGFTTAMRGELVPLSPSSSSAALSGSLSSSSKSSRSVQTKLTSCTLFT